MSPRCHRGLSGANRSASANKLVIKKGDDGIWLIGFMHYDLRNVDLEQMTAQPTDNRTRANIALL